MPRYFIEVNYKGTAYSGFQIQKNAITVQSEIEKSLEIYFKRPFSLTGSSRTDAGVHALQNFFHFDTNELLPGRVFQGESATIKDASLEDGDIRTAGALYNLNAILPMDIVAKRLFQVENDAHCRFDAVAREYKYFLYREKNPFLQDRAYFFPFNIDIAMLNNAASILLDHKDFTSFSKRNTQVNNFICSLEKSEWIIENNLLVYHVKGNRFLRGMVKGLVGTMIRVGTHKISLDQFKIIVNNKDCTKADFSVPSHALFLVAVLYS